MILYKDKVIKDSYQIIINIDQLKELKRKSILISIDFWKTHKELIIKHKSNIGLEINSDQPLESVRDDFDYFKLIQFKFITFKDGRPFSLAKKLRRFYNFKNEIRASGHILPDQYVFLTRCGFNSVNIEEKSLETWLKFLKMDEGIYYQP
ncbi:MAG: hypothetical protein CMM95_00915 [Rickettsiales bacterium]|nr:hypothetical protein [Rickettsiales bacterium]